MTHHCHPTPLGWVLLGSVVLWIAISFLLVAVFG